MDDAFSPLENYGVIGNLETCALINRDGAIDWCCLPYVFSPSVFAAILDPEKGGYFAIRPAHDYDAEQAYLDSTNILKTTFETASGTATVTDFMPVVEQDSVEEPWYQALYRKVTCTDGSVDMAVEFVPRFDYARTDTVVESIQPGAIATGGDWQVTLDSPVELRTSDDEAHAEYTLSAGDACWFVLQYSMHAPASPSKCEQLLEETADFWREWTHSCEESECIFGGVGHDLVVRSELVLKLLSYRETGALLAAPTTSLPEDPGGVRNWDYRFSWLRDSAMTVRALTNLGHNDMAKEYVHRFLEQSREGDTAEVQPLFGVEGDTALDDEEKLDHLRGYRDSRPVRIGNEAAEQQQLDIYGNLVLAIYQRLWDTDKIPKQDWQAVRDIADYVYDHWDDPGSGIWELRGESRQLVHSKVMCWVALDRAIDLADRGEFDAPLDRWRECRSTIKETVLERGFDEEVNAFTRSFDGQELDATGLLIPLTGFLDPDDSRIQGTIDAIMDRLMVDDGLVYRYEDDSLPGDEGAFVICSFWLVNALTITGRTDEAWEIFENVLDYASPLGLFAEEVNPETGRLLGNYPQAFSHIGLINSALYLREAENDWATAGPFGTPTLRQERGTD